MNKNKTTQNQSLLHNKHAPDTQTEFGKKHYLGDLFNQSKQSKPY